MSGTLIGAPAASSPNVEGLNQFIATQMKEASVPGLAIAIVHNGKIIHSTGYGFRDVEKRLPVTTKTIFAIGSITKSVAVVTLGTLVDEGKLDWDKPVSEYLPNFRLYDPLASERITMRDLVSHRSGMPSHDFFMYHSGFSQKEMIERLRYLEPKHDFRTTYQYSNLLFMTAGNLAGQLAGTSWDDLENDELRLAYNKKAPSALIHVHYDIFEFAPEPADESSGKLKLSFLTNFQGEIDHLLIPMEEKLKAIVFVRR